MSDLLCKDAPDVKDLRISSLFIDSMDHRYRESVVKRALTSREDVPNAIRESLNAVIDDTIRIPGFRPGSASNAPAQRIVTPILNRIHFSAPLATAILKSWVASFGDLQNTVTEHLESIGVTPNYPDFAKNRFRGYQPIEDLIRARAAIVQSSEFDLNDVALMLCYVSGAVPTSSQEAIGEKNEEAHPILSQVIQYLRDLPANSSAWEGEVPDFQDSIARIAVDKKDERDDEAHREGLRIAIAEINEHDWAGFWELDKHEWSMPSGISSSDVSECLRLLNELESAFGEYASIPDRGVNRNQTVAFQQQQSEVEDKIDSSKSKLDRILTPVDHPSGGLPHDHSPSGEIEPNTPDAEKSEVVSATQETAVRAQPVTEAIGASEPSVDISDAEEHSSDISDVPVSADTDLDQASIEGERSTPVTGIEREDAVEATVSYSEESEVSTDSDTKNAQATVSPVDLSNAAGDFGTRREGRIS